MSAVTGVLYRDRRATSAAALLDLLPSLQARGPDGTRVHTQPGLVMAHCAFHFDKWSRLERQPCVLADGSVLTWDGRLDNRSELALTLARDLTEPPTDAALVAAAYTKWRSGAFSQLRGDWSLTVWDAASDELLLARDHAGNRPLYYAVSHDRCLWATCLEALVSALNAYDAIDTEYLATLLFARQTLEGRTPYRSTACVPAGHFVRVGRDLMVSCERYWSIEPRTIRFSDSRDYEARFREIFIAGLQARLRCDKPAWAELSGGMDSSSIVCASDALCRTSEAASPGLNLVSYVFDRSRESDERAHIETVEAWCGLSSLRLDGDRTPTLDGHAGIHPWTPGFEHIAVATRMNEAGARVLLSGEIGDLVMGKNSAHAVSLLEHLAALRPGRFVHGAFVWARRTRTPISSVVARILKTAFGAPPGAPVASAGWNPAFVRLANPGTSDATAHVKAFAPSKRFLVRQLEWWLSNNLLLSSELVPSIRVTFPLADRALIEFVTAIPETALWTPSRSRSLMRGALRDVLPESIQQRRQKGDGTPAVSRLVRDLAREALNDASRLRIIEHGLANQAEVTALLHDLVNGSTRASVLARPLLGIERWLRFLEKGGRQVPGVIAS